MGVVKSTPIPDLEGEVWKDVPGYEGVYMISSFGRVKSLDRLVMRTNGNPLPIKGQIIKPNKPYVSQISPLTVSQVSLCRVGEKKKEISIIGLMGMVFLPPAPKEDMEIGLKDYSATTYSIDNLQWTTRSKKMFIVNNHPKNPIKLGLKRKRGADAGDHSERERAGRCAKGHCRVGWK
jgi:hypothetical protein